MKRCHNIEGHSRFRFDEGGLRFCLGGQCSCYGYKIERGNPEFCYMIMPNRYMEILYTIN